MAKEKTFEIPNVALSLLYALIDVPVHGAQCRARNRVAKTLREWLFELEEQRIKLLEAHAEKDEKGAPKRTGDGEKEQYDLTPENLAKFRQEYDDLMHAPSSILLDAGAKADLVMLRPLVLESKVPLRVADGYNYEALCKAFEML